ncbi:MAG: hypothetical protein WB053_03870 [Nitrososphaeraceae archaeon]
MSRNIIMMYVLLAFMLTTAIVYFIVASQEYSDLLEFQEVGIDGETQEKQVEITLFIGSGVTYIGLFAWILGAKLRSKTPYVVVAGVSGILIATYIASRTVGVPIVGVEYYVGKLDMVGKALQVIIIGLSIYLTFRIRKIMIIKSMNKKNMG